MKKLIALTVLVVAGVAFASSMSVPWFVDNAGAGAKFPPKTNVSALVYLHNNETTPWLCAVRYFAPSGAEQVLDDNTFIIPALATLAYRPHTDDLTLALGGLQGGQESLEANAIPDSPIENGSIVIQWAGGSSGSVQGMIVQGQAIDARAADGPISAQPEAYAMFGTLLPPGV